MKSLLCILFIFVSVSHADRSVQGSLVSANNIVVDGTADGTVTINLGLVNTPPSLLVTSSGLTTIGVNAVASASLSLALPNNEGILALGFVGYAGLQITSSNTSATLTLQLVTPSFTALFTAGTQVAGIFYADGSAYVNIPTTTTSSGQLTAQLPSVGSYVFVSIDKMVAADYSVPRAVIAGANRTYQWANNFAIQFWSQTSNTIDVVAANVTAEGTVAQRAAIGIALDVYFSIDLGTAASHVSQIQYTYTDAELTAKGIAADAAAGLRWAYYDTVAAIWKLAEQASTVSVSAKVVAQTTTHFSTWGVFYASSSTLLLPISLYLTGLFFYCLML